MALTQRTLTQEETKAMALYFQASFIAVIAANRTQNFIDQVKATEPYRKNQKLIKKYIKRTEDYIAQLYRSVFDGYTSKVQEYLDLAAYFSKEEIVQQCTIKNTFTFHKVQDADIAAAHLHAFFLCTLAELIITEGNIEKLAEQMAIFNKNATCGISAIRKNFYIIADCFGIDIPKDSDLNQVFAAYTIFEDHFIKNEELLFQIIAANGLKIVPPPTETK